MILETTTAEAWALTKSAGKAALNAQFPNDFEYYMLALELVNSQGKIVEYFSFPVMPNSITQQEVFVNNIQTTASGIVNTGRKGFVPLDIQINGNFGRKFKFLLRETEYNAAGFAWSIENASSFTDVKKNVFNPSIKTGYGCTKVLQALLRKAQQLDDTGKPYQLYLYNPAIGDNYLVKVTSLQLKQTKEQNMIWEYNIGFKAIAPIDELVLQRETTSIKSKLKFDEVQKRTTRLLHRLSNLGSKGLGTINKAV